jgi:hypothetical protein
MLWCRYCTIFNEANTSPRSQWKHSEAFGVLEFLERDFCRAFSSAAQWITAADHRGRWTTRVSFDDSTTTTMTTTTTMKARSVLPAPRCTHTTTRNECTWTDEELEEVPEPSFGATLRKTPLQHCSLIRKRKQVDRGNVVPVGIST